MLNATGISVHTYLNLNFQRTFRILPRFNRRQISWREPVLVDRSLLPSETIHDMRMVLALSHVGNDVDSEVSDHHDTLVGQSTIDHINKRLQTEQVLNIL